jgi:hypothetical protein
MIFSFVMRGLDPRIHRFAMESFQMDRRVFWHEDGAPRLMPGDDATQ